MATRTQPSLLSGYAARPGQTDEMLNGEGGVQPAWRYLADALDTLGPASLQLRQQQIRRLLRERGVTYNVYGDPRGRERTWDLDPIPVLIGSDEWAQVEHGLQQRADLFNLILRDLYGPQDLLNRGLLPPELLHAHSGFLRPCYPYGTGAAHGLTLYAADLARDNEGRFRVLEDRTQSPSGAGYALENRVVMMQALPSLFRESHVHRLALFFQNLRATLASLAPERDRDEPHVVVLTPGPLNETYFEHAFLASYLGYTLVEGGDLTVRDGRVWLRSMGRLEPVDVILRRLDEDFCDALELRADSLLGVPGLVEVVRQGRVAVANPLGAGVLENPALNAFLPGIARHFLGQELALPGPPTWWCGDPDAREHVLAHLDTLVVRPVDPRANEGSVFPGELAQADREALRERIRWAPHRYAAQAPAANATVPTLSADARLEPRPAVLRTFLVARSDGYAVMPGALARVARGASDRTISNQSGGLSKDTWVLATEPVREAAFLAEEGADAGPTDRSAALPPAATENLFWMARYAERAEQGLRLLRVILHQQARTPVPPREGDAACRAALLDALGQVTGAGPVPAPDGTDGTAGPLAGLEPFLLDARRTGSVAFNLQAMLAASHAVRDRLSADSWRVAGSLRRRLAEVAVPVDGPEIEPLIDELITLLAALRGLQDDTMIHSRAWRFLEMGRCLERGLLTGACLQATLVRPPPPSAEPLLLDAVLDHLESLNAYRREHHHAAQPDSVLQLVLLGESNPRSLAFQLERLEAAVARLPDAGSAEHLSPEQRRVLEARTALRLSAPETLLAASADGRRDALQALLAQIARLLGETARGLAAAYFSDPQGPRQLEATGARRGSAP